jgi:hypothetical protein
MTTCELADDGSFEIEAGDGLVRVERGFAIFEFDARVFACPPRQVQEKLAAAGSSHPVIAAAVQKQQAPRPAVAVASVSKPAAREPVRTRPVIGKPPVIEWHAPADLKVDDTYQRSIENGASQKLIRKIAIDWDWRLCVPLIVSRRAEGLFVIDGQHRVEGARLRDDIPFIPCATYDFQGPEAEAELFVQANRARRPMQRLDDFHAAIVAGDENAIAVNEVVAEAGLRVGRNQAWQMLKQGEVIFIGAIMRVMRVHGREVALTALTLIARAFEGQILSSASSIFDSLGTLIAERIKAGDPIDPELMCAVLADSGMTGWKAAVAGAANGWERNDQMLTALKAAYAEAEAQ